MNSSKKLHRAKLNFLNLTKSNYKEPIDNIIEKDWMISLKIRKKVRISAPTTITQHSETLDNEVSLGKEITGIQIGKEEIKPFLFVDSMEVFVENRKESTKNLL